MRAPLQYYGGKGNMIAKLLPLLPRHQVYCEPFFGGGSLFFAKPPSPVEVINDLDAALITLMRGLQDPATYPELAHRLRHTLYSRAEFCRALAWLQDPARRPVETAWALFVAKNQGFSGSAATPGNWARTFTQNRGMAKTCNGWTMRLALLPDWHRRLLAAQIDNRDALEVIRYWDTPATLFYLDPPYVHTTRANGHTDDYTHEMTDRQHQALVALLLEIQGAVVLSGYDSALYAPLADAGWHTLAFKTVSYAAGRNRKSGIQGPGAAHAKLARTEVVWMNRAPRTGTTQARQQTALPF